MKYSFFAHFNRVSMQRGERTVWTVHFRGACLPAHEVEFRVPVKTRFRPEGSQPRATLRGKACSANYDGTTLVIS